MKTHLPDRDIPAPADTEQDIIADPETEALWQEIQAAWDARSRHVEESLASHAQQYPLQINFANSRSTQRRVRAGFLLPAIASLFLCVCSVLSSLHTDDHLLHILFNSLSTVSAVIAIVSFLPILRSNATRFINWQPSFLYKTCTVCLTLAAVLVMSSCTPVGDGFTMTQTGRSERVATVAAIDTVLDRQPA
jgi:hypothetical protein